MRIVITGAGIVSAIGIGKAATLEALREQRTGIAPLHYLKTTHTEFPVGEVKLSDDEMKQRLSISTEPTTRTALLGMLAMDEALQEAGLSGPMGPISPISPISPRGPIAFISGTTVGGMDKSEQYYPDFLDNDTHNDYIRTHDCGATTDMIARRYGSLFTFATSISTACSSAANAIILGANLIRSGQTEIAVVGGAECITKYHLNGFNSLMILDHDQCRPFDANRAGLNLGEGAFLAMQQALTRAGLQPQDISYVNAHGTGTPNNDLSESRALMRLFGTSLPPISSTKGMTGHTTSVSGSVEATICLLALHHQLIPANYGWQTPMDEGIVPATDTTPIQPLQHVMCNSFGFGGNDSSLILSAP